MRSPTVSVVMPARNAESTIEEAVASILRQTFTDLELVVLDDESSDSTLARLRAIDDTRVRVVQNETRLGVARSLNKGMDLARGRYVARMDADDVSLAPRLELQVAYLERHPEVDVVATCVALVDARGAPAGTWRDDQDAVTPEAIRRRLMRRNCIAHPSVLMRAELIRQYRYNEETPWEDYDLWLRVASDGRVIAKIAEPLLRYRVWEGSTVSQAQRAGKNLHNTRVTKRNYLRSRIGEGRWTRFESGVAASLVSDEIVDRLVFGPLSRVRRSIGS